LSLKISFALSAALAVIVSIAHLVAFGKQLLSILSCERNR